MKHDLSRRHDRIESGDATMTDFQNHLTHNIPRADFVRSELAKIADRSSGAGMTEPGADVDYLLGLAIGEELAPETLDALVSAIKSDKVDWPYQFWSARYYGRDARLDQVLQKAELDHLRAEHPVESGPMMDLATALSEMMLSL
jgi:hypothetical protein